MAKISIVPELVENHSDEELIEYLNGVMGGVVRNFKVSLEKGDSSILWANIGDLSLVSNILRVMKKRNDERSAQP